MRNIHTKNNKKQLWWQFKGEGNTALCITQVN